MIFLLCVTLVFLRATTNGAVRPPPWADPKVNPCARLPRGWQYIYWPADGNCHKIFQIGYPCPETMELGPAVSTKRPGVKAECRCPPSYALHKTDGRCYQLFKKEPCASGQFFAPHEEIPINPKSNIRYGICKSLETCMDSEHVFWPVDEKCYRKYTQGPCPKGQLLLVDSESVPVCACTRDGELEKFYWEPKNTCYAHYTKGPCLEEGHLFLPGKTCGCHDELPHYHEETGRCYEIDSIGPCRQGHEFKLEMNSNTSRATCKCKEGHIYWPEDQKCYRPYTQGPCPRANILMNSTTCIPIPCERGSLYFPEQQTCYRIGSQGPCTANQIVTFDFRTRPSVDGISYNGICRCSGPLRENNSCLKEKRSTKSCENGLAMFKSRCYKLYSQGPCKQGQWLVPNRQAKIQTWQDTLNKNTGKCECRPGYETVLSNDKSIIRCLPPTVSLANYLNKNFMRNHSN